MPRPATPIVPGANLPEVIFAKDQPEYNPLPAYRAPDGTVLTRYRFTWRERIQLLFTGSLYVWILTFNQPLQPMRIDVEKPEVSRL